jgi:RNA polymerase sigma factor (sigma-70 family)
MSEAKKYGEYELVTLLRQRDREAFSYLYDNYSPALYTVILSIVPDREQANDLLQDVFIKIWKQVDSYDVERGRLYTWMIQVARNSAIDVVRSTRYKQLKQNQAITESVYGSESHEFNPDKIGLRRVVHMLRQEHRELVELSYFQGFTQEEISKELDIPLGTVKSRLRNALIQLRNMFKQ